MIEAKFKQAYQLAMSAGDNDNTFVFLCPEFTLLNMADIPLPNLKEDHSFSPKVNI